MRFLEHRIPPPLVGLIIGAGMAGVAHLAPAEAWPTSAPLALAIILATLGFCIALSGVWAFRRARTTVNPLKPEQASAMVISGIYRWTRNPMYLGMLLVLSGWGVSLSNSFALLGLPLFVLFIQRFQIAPEERALAQRFGDEFERYRQRVRRWL